MSISTFQYRQMLLRQGKLPTPADADAVAKELPLHDQIIAFCNAQWPRWKFIRARPDERSTIANGAQDFTIWMPGNKVLCIECKSKDGKRSDDQTIWAAEMAMLGVEVRIVRSMAAFLKYARGK